MNLTGEGAEYGCARVAVDFDDDSWTIAVGMASAAAFVNNLGVNTQKLAWAQMKEGTGRGLWVAGMGLIVLASLLDFGALAFGP